jgi:hypothetical protein
MKNEHDILINVVELASLLAEKDLEQFYSNVDIYDTSDDEIISFTDEGQDIFNELYDKYYTIILNCKSL